MKILIIILLLINSKDLFTQNSYENIELNFTLDRTSLLPTSTHKLDSIITQFKITTSKTIILYYPKYVYDIEDTLLLNSVQGHRSYIIKNHIQFHTDSSIKITTIPIVQKDTCFQLDHIQHTLYSVYFE